MEKFVDRILTEETAGDKQIKEQKAQNEADLKCPFTGQELMFIPESHSLKKQSSVQTRLSLERLCNKFPSWNDNQVKE